MKCDKNFKLNKQTKRYIATINDPIKRSEFKNAMIEAQLVASIPFKSEKKNKKESVEE